MARTMRKGSAAYKIVRATLVITTPLPSLENSSKRDGAQLKKAFAAGTFVLQVHSLGTTGTPASTFYLVQPTGYVRGSQVGTGIALETTKL